MKPVESAQQRASHRLPSIHRQCPGIGLQYLYAHVVCAGVEMSAHESSAKELAEAMLKVEAWLSRELAGS